MGDYRISKTASWLFPTARIWDLYPFRFPLYGKKFYWLVSVPLTFSLDLSSSCIKNTLLRGSSSFSSFLPVRTSSKASGVLGDLCFSWVLSGVQDPSLSLITLLLTLTTEDTPGGSVTGREFLLSSFFAILVLLVFFKVLALFKMLRFILFTWIGMVGGSLLSSRDWLLTMLFTFSALESTDGWYGFVLFVYLNLPSN